LKRSPVRKIGTQAKTLLWEKKILNSEENFFCVSRNQI